MKILLPLLTLAIAVGSYFLVEKQGWRWDLTQNKEFTLSEQTQKILENLSQDINIKAFFRRGEDVDAVFIRRRVDDILREYAHASSRIHYEMLDPDTNLEKVEKNNVAQAGTIIFQSGSYRKEIYQSQLFDFHEVTEHAPPQFVGENLFTQAILSVTRSKKEVVCFLSGHGERSLEDTSPAGFRETMDYLSNNNYEVKPFSLITTPQIPSGCHLLLVAGPTQKITEPEERRIKNWLVEKKGKAIFLLDPSEFSPLPNTLTFLGISLAPNTVVLDPKRHLVLGAHFPAPFLADHPITETIQNADPIFSTAAPLILPNESQKPEFKIEPLFTTTPEAWGETNVDASELKFDAGKDRKGPLTMGAAIEKYKENGEPEPFIVIVGDADFASNGLIQAPGNLDLFLNMTGWLVGNEMELAIPSQTPGIRILSLTKAQAQVVAYFSQFIYPLLVLILGGLYWARRRKFRKG